MESTPLEKKQSYLDSEIVKKGYDPEVFIEFLKQKKGEEFDKLEKVSQQELEILVKEFTNTHELTPTQQSNIQTTNEDNLFPVSIRDMESPDSPMPELTEQNNQVKNSLITNTRTYVGINVEDIICKGPEKGPLSEIMNLEVVLSFPQKAKGTVTFL